MKEYIIWVDDNIEDFEQLLKHHYIPRLAKNGYSVITAKSSKEGLAKFEEIYDDGNIIILAVIDYRMPVMNGAEIIEEIIKRKEEKSPAFMWVLPILWSAIDGSEVASNIGAYTALSKMENNESSLLTIESVCEIARGRRIIQSVLPGIASDIDCIIKNLKKIKISKTDNLSERCEDIIFSKLEMIINIINSIQTTP